ncbi:MAG: ABC transporter permease [Pseudomonadota bacterium]
MRAYLAYTQFETKLFFREFIAVFFTLVVPALICSVVMARMGSSAEIISTFQQHMPAIVATLAVIVAMFVLTGNLVVSRELGFFKRILATPVGPETIAASTATRGLIVVTVATIEILLICLVFTGQLPSFDPFGFFLALFLAGSALFIAGFCIAAFVQRAQTMFVVANIAAQVLIFTSPFGLDWLNAPEAFRPISLLNPVTHAVDLLALGWNGNLLSLASLRPLVALVAFSTVGVMIARRTFSWTS